MTHQYPDVLGYIAGQRHVIDPVQVALTTRPDQVEAGFEFEVLIVLQNMLDAAVDVTVTLHFPEKDKAGQKDRFISSQRRIAVTLKGGEVGYITLPMITLADTAPATDYTIGIEVETKPLSAGDVIRAEGLGDPFDPAVLPPMQAGIAEELHELNFNMHAHTRGLINSRTIIETTLIVEAGQMGHIPRHHPGWFSLWTLADTNNITLLIEKFGDPFQQKVLPALKVERLFVPLGQRLVGLFQQSGYGLSKVEAKTATRLLVATLLAALGQSGPIQVGSLDVLSSIRAHKRSIRRGTSRKMVFDETAATQILLPRWAEKYMRLMCKEPRIANAPVKVIAEILFDELLFDAMVYGLRLIARDSGADLGTEDEMIAYSEQMVTRLRDHQPMDFGYAYLPLILGGVIVTDQVLLPEERLPQVMEEMALMLEKREDEIDRDSQPIYEIGERIFEIVLKKYGFKGNR
jgi:hypothetical protein